MTTIYIVQTGSYSDKSIHSVWSSEENAQKVIDVHGDNAYIEEFELDAPFKEVSGWMVVVNSAGAVIDGPHAIILYDGPQILSPVDYAKMELLRKIDGLWMEVDRHGRQYICKIIAKHISPDLALKAAQDAAAEFRAWAEGV